jgi:hypothetical protein
MDQVEPGPERALRTLSGEIVAPVVTGPVELTVEVLRKGSGLSSLAARLRQDGEVRAHASAIYAKQRLVDRDRTVLVPPRVKPWTETEVIPIGPPLGPTFAQSLEFRPDGPSPFSEHPEALASGWVRSRVPFARLGAPELVALADAYWPTGLAIEPMPRPMATIGFTFQLCIDPATLNPTEPLYHRGTMQAAHDGYFAELRELWTPDGRLVALNPQTFAIIK